jgi:hypothetical protein
LLGLSRVMVRRRTSARKKRSVAYTGLRAAPAKRSGLWVLVVLAVLVVVNLYVFVWDKKTGVRAIKEQAEAQPAGMTVPERPLAPAPGIPTAAATTIEGRVVRSDTLGRLLKRSGLTAAEGDEVIRSLSGVLDFRTIKSGERYRIDRGADGRVQRFDLEVSKTHHVRAERNPAGELVGAAP